MPLCCEDVPARRTTASATPAIRRLIDIFNSDRFRAKYASSTPRATSARWRCAGSARCSTASATSRSSVSPAGSARISDYTLVIPTHNRLALLGRLLRYLRACEVSFPILILDSSDAAGPVGKRRGPSSRRRSISRIRPSMRRCPSTVREGAPWRRERPHTVLLLLRGRRRCGVSGGTRGSGVVSAKSRRVPRRPRQLRGLSRKGNDV